MSKRRLAEWSSLVVVGLLMAYASYMGWEIHAEGKLTTTIVRMRELMGVLAADQPTDVSPRALGAVLAKNGREECATDAWGHVFEVSKERLPNQDELGYTLRSFGSDGIRGSCCELLVPSSKDDAVLRGATWLQIWRAKAGS